MFWPSWTLESHTHFTQNNKKKKEAQILCFVPSKARKRQWGFKGVIPRFLFLPHREERCICSWSEFKMTTNTFHRGLIQNHSIESECSFRNPDNNNNNKKKTTGFEKKGAHLLLAVSISVATSLAYEQSLWLWINNSGNRSVFNYLNQNSHSGQAFSIACVYFERLRRRGECGECLSKNEKKKKQSEENVKSSTWKTKWPLIKANTKPSPLPPSLSVWTVEGIIL